MNAEGPNQRQLDELPEIAVESRKGISMVWLIPLVAALIGIWLAYQTLSEMGPTVTISFVDGSGLEAGKTKVKFKAVEVGLVEAVDIKPDLTGVTVTAQLARDAEPHLTENTKFWVVRPRIGAGGITGLETLVSGAYIEIDPSPGPLTKTFVGLETPPLVKSREPGTKYILRAQKLGSLQPGAPVLYRDINVGEIMGYDLAENDQGVLIHTFIREPHDQRVRDNSRFWRRSGIEVEVGAEGFDVKMESLAAVLAGGVAFDTPPSIAAGDEPSEPGTMFTLHDSFSDVGEATFVRRNRYLLYFDGSVRGLSVGAPVEFRGIRIGTVKDIAVEINPKTLEIKIPVIVETQPERWMSQKELKELKTKAGTHIDRTRRMVARGLRAQLQTGSLITGQLFVQLDFYPKLPPAKLTVSRNLPVVPTVPSTMDQFRRTVTDVLEELRRLPLDKIAHELLETMEGANRLVNSPELIESVRTLNETLVDFQKLTQNVDKEVIRLADSTDKTLKAGRAALSVADPNSPAAVNLANALRELAAAARSVRMLADYLERHPEALVHGKGGPRR